MASRRYIGLIDGKKGAYGIVIPDLPGCTAMGRTIDEAMQNATLAMRDWAEVAIEHGQKIPAPQAVDRFFDEAKETNSGIVVVPLLLDSGRPAKANLSLDSGLLQVIDEEAQARGLTRSTFVASTMREKIAAEG